jgi:hypothetical protein
MWRTCVPEKMEEINDTLSQLGQLKDGEWDLSRYGLICKVWYEDMIGFRYVDTPLLMVREEKGVMYGSEIQPLCAKLKKNGSIYQKPKPVRLLEQVMETSAFLSGNIGQWHIEIADNVRQVKIDCVKDGYEIMFGDGQPYHCPLETLLKILFDNDYIVNRCRQCERYDRLMLRCKGSCGKTFYCNTECQRTNWEKHRLICKK